MKLNKKKREKCEQFKINMKVAKQIFKIFLSCELLTKMFTKYIYFITKSVILIRDI